MTRHPCHCEAREAGRSNLKRDCFVPLATLGVLAMTLCALLMCSVARAETPDELFRQGNEAYAQGQYEEAARHYEDILAKEMSSNAVHYNLGNAYFKSGRHGRAILNYERALRLDPLDSLTRTNLDWVKTQLKDKITPRGSGYWARKADEFFALWSVEGCVHATTIVYFVFFAFAALELSLARIRGPRPGFYSSSRGGRLRPFLWMLGLVLVSMLTVTGVEVARARSHEAIVITPSALVRYAPAEKEQVAFTLHEGTKCEIRSQFSGWYRIRIADGKSGWVETSALEPI